MKINEIIILTLFFIFIYRVKSASGSSGQGGSSGKGSGNKRGGSSAKREAQEKCKTYGENNKVRKFEECNVYSNSSLNIVCCYVTGTNPDKSDYDGCIGLSSVFANKSLSYETKTFSAKLICEENYSFHKIIKLSVIISMFSFVFQYL